MAYFYCDFRDDDKQNCRNLTRDKCPRKSSDETLTKCLTDMLSLPAQVPIYLIVDALDECPNNSGMPIPREEILDLVKNRVGLHPSNLHWLHIYVTSRSWIDIQTILEPFGISLDVPP